MKRILCVLALFFAVQTTFSQSDDDYENVLENITTLFNTNKAEEIYNLFSKEHQATINISDFKKEIEQYAKELGSISSHEFWMEGERGNGYLLEFDKASMVLILKLSPEKKITDFIIQEY